MLLALTGAASLVWGIAQVATSIYKLPPPRAEFARAWEAGQRDAARRAFADALKGIEYPDEPMLETMPLDPEATWALGPYGRSLAKGIADRIRYRTTDSVASGAIYLGFRFLALGIAVLLLFDLVLMRLLNWIIRGDSKKGAI